MKRFFETTKQRILGKEKTVDERFEAQRNQFKRLRDALQIAEKQVKKLDKELKELGSSTTSLSADVASLYDLSKPEIGERCKAQANQFVAASLECGEAVSLFDTYLRSKLDRCSSLAGSIDKRDEALLYADAKRDALAALREKPPKDASKVGEAEDKYNAALSAYAELNDALIGDLEQFGGVASDIDPQYRAFLQAQLRFAMQAGEAWNRMSH